MILIRDDGGTEPSTWKPARGDARALVICKCGARQYLTFHRISPEGQVTPALVCACGFNGYVSLAGWAP